jgi:SAM-dependent methyltransferase
MATNYDAITEEYQRSKLQPWRKHIETHSLFELTGDLTGKRVLDLACGEGFHTRLLVHRGASSVVGVDLSGGMIDLARSQEALDPLGIEYLVDDARSLDLGERFDLVFAAWLLNYAEVYDDLLAMFQTIARHLAPGARFVTINNNPDYRGQLDSMRPYGFTRAAPEPVDGAPTEWTFFLSDGPFSIMNYYLSIDTHERAMAEARLVSPRWVHAQVDPEGIDELGDDHWSAFLDLEPAILLECAAP